MAYTHESQVEQVEVRIPTYNRNNMLSCSLDSLIAQSWQNWRATVFDDANDASTLELVRTKGDSRILYKPNNKRLGAAENLNQCFQTKGYDPNSVYACCLEDDNWLYPNAIKSNIETLKIHDAHILMRNQDIFSRSEEGVTPTGSTTLLQWFSEERLYEPVELAARSIFYTGISNGALFWRTNARTDLQDPYSVIDPSLQEYIRCWQVRDPVYVRLDAALAYSDPVGKTDRHYTSDRSFSRALQQGHRRMLMKYGQDFISKAASCSRLFDMEGKLSQSLSNIATWASMRGLLSEDLPIDINFMLRGIIKRLTVASLIANF